MTGQQAREAGIHITSRTEPYLAMMRETAWPVVEFIRSKHATGQYFPKTLIPQMEVEVTNAEGGMEACRHQVPLILAWYVLSHLHLGVVA